MENTKSTARQNKGLPRNLFPLSRSRSIARVRYNVSISQFPSINNSPQHEYKGVQVCSNKLPDSRYLEKKMAGSVAAVSVLEAPILVLVSFHKAIRAELEQIWRIVSSCPFDIYGFSPTKDVVVDLEKRFRFLKVAYKYHCVAEDEIIFQALDSRVANVACTYSLEHSSIDELFDSIFQSLSVLLEEDGTKRFEELMHCTATIQTSICWHMLKEEEQVFTLLVQQFSFREQASLVWQFFCSVPIVLLEDLLPWMMSHLPKAEQDDVANCMKEVVPKEKLLQEMVASWLGTKILHSSTCFISRESKMHIRSYNGMCSQGESNCFQEDAKCHPVNSLYPWHGAIIKDLKKVLEELYEIRTSKVFSHLASICGQLKFLLDVLMFYSDALDNVLFPVLSEVVDSWLAFPYKGFPNGSCIEGLLRLLQRIDFQNEVSLCKTVENLCKELEDLTEGIREYFAFQELEVFSLIHKHCNHKMQHRLLFVSLHMMPLGLLKRVITWLSEHLNEVEVKAVLCSIKLAGSELDMSFTSLLHKWVSIGYSCKTSHENFKRDLQKLFRKKSYHIAKNIEERTGFTDLDAPNSPDKAVQGAFSYSLQNMKEKDITIYSSEINQQIYFPNSVKKPSPFSQYLAEKSGSGPSLELEFRPIDYVFLFHKALLNDLNYFVLESVKMFENVGILEDFFQRFHLVHFLYQIHSDHKDKIASPALETKGQPRNISLSYAIDHKLEIEYFNCISVILDEIRDLHVSLTSEQSILCDAKLGQKMLMYHRLCIELHSKCKTIWIIVGKHFMREEIELWPLFTEYFSDEEQRKILGNILGNMRAEILQQMIPWLMASLSSGEQLALMSLLRKATDSTMFDEWLEEWWDSPSTDDMATAAEESITPPWTIDPLEVVATYLSNESLNELHDKGLTLQTEDSITTDSKVAGNSDGDDKTKALLWEMDDRCSGLNVLKSKDYEQEIKVIDDTGNRKSEFLSNDEKFSHLEERFLAMTQEELEAVIRRVYNDTSLDTQRKSYITQTLLTSRWTLTHQKPHQEVILQSSKGIPGQSRSYRDPLNFGCKHYKRNCKIFAACCEKLFTCRLCHDETADHAMDRMSTTKMMCMKCLKVQPVGATCSSISCNGFSMAKYFCRICKLYDNERDIYHCPYCNLCRVGKGLGVDYFHCMKCNACISKSQTAHVCREKGFESNCPICHEEIFTSRSTVKSLPCGHLMHSACFKDYTCMHYTCPICRKSLGDMKVYFQMLDTLLAEEELPEEYYGRTQEILCNDCENKGVSSFHWLYHKCSICDSYNTRLL